MSGANEPREAAGLRFKPYPAYKDSGVEWLGKIPRGWGIKCLKRIVQFRGGGTPTKDNAEYWRGDIPWVSPKDMKVSVVVDTEDKITAQAIRDSATKLVQAGAVLIVVRSGILVHSIPVALAGREVTLNQDLKALIPSSELLPEYLVYLISGMQRELLVEWKKEGATVESLDLELVANTPTPLPASAEQRAIAAFLDRETARIDALVAKKERLIELLQEKRTALITRAITKGLDPNVPMKDSGVEWLGEIPAHWEVKSLKRISRRVDVGIAEAATHAYADEGVPIIRSTNVRANQLLAHDLLRIERSFAEKHRSKYLFAGDLVTVRTGVPGTTAVVPDELDRSQCFTMLISTPQKGHVSAFLSYFLNSTSAQVYFELEGWGTAQTNISVPILQRIPIPVPSEDQQKTIVAYIESEIARIDGLLARVQEAIDRLKEFRTALISTAVTGKIDVREEASRIAGTAPPC